MHQLPTLSILWVGPAPHSRLRQAWNGYRALALTVQSRLAENPHGDVIIVAEPDGLGEAEWSTLQRFAGAGGGVLVLAQETTKRLPPFLGVEAGPAGPRAEIRVLFSDREDPIGTRLPEAFYLGGSFRPLEVRAEGVREVLYADWRYEHRPVLTVRPVGRGRAAVTTLQDFEHPRLPQLLYRVVRHLAGAPNRHEPLGVGLLGYAPSVGELHGQGAAAVPGLALRAACDLSEVRLAAARTAFPDIALHARAAALAADPAVDVVIIATPPNTHAALSVQMLEAGKHVICEKPLAITTAETERMIAAARRHGRHLSCHQNRRWDVDYRAIRQALEEGLIGELFYAETFVGTYQHPCGFWHSHDAVSGGTTYDWGAHYLDWLLSLLPEPVTGVIGTRQNRVWHDVTNADQERIQLRFAGGQEMEFIHSDVAAVRKPKWYLLGSEGGIIGRWRDVTSYEIDPLHYYDPQEIPATEMTPELTLRRRHRSGQMVSRELALPPRERFGFHRNLANHLLTGEPIVAPVEHSARVVAVLEAAARSAEQGGTLEKIHV
jgi:predicted dehydrogenase